MNPEQLRWQNCGRSVSTWVVASKTTRDVSLEDNSPESLAWQTAQNALAERRLRDVGEGFDSLTTMLRTALGRDIRQRAPSRLRRPLAALCVRRRWRATGVGCGGCGSVARGIRGRGVSEPGRPGVFDCSLPSPDGHYAAVGVSSARRRTVSCVCLVLSRRSCPVAVPECWNSRVAWLPDSSGLFFPVGSLCDRSATRPAVPGGRRGGTAARVHSGSADCPGFDPEPLGGYPQFSADRRSLTLSSSRSGGRVVLARRLPDRSSFEVLEDHTDKRAYRFVDGDDYIAVTSGDPPRRRFVRFPIMSAHDRSTSVDPVPESEEVLVSVDSVAGQTWCAVSRTPRHASASSTRWDAC